jgi:hypothetical protein
MYADNIGANHAWNAGGPCMGKMTPIAAAARHAKPTVIANKNNMPAESCSMPSMTRS